VVAAAAELGAKTKERRRWGWYIRPRGMVVVVVVANPLEGVETLGLTALRSRGVVYGPSVSWADCKGTDHEGVETLLLCPTNKICDSPQKNCCRRKKYYRFIRTFVMFFWLQCISIMPTCLFFEYSTDLLIIINTLARDEGALPSSLIHHQSRTKFVVIDRRKNGLKRTSTAQQQPSHNKLRQRNYGPIIIRHALRTHHND
jgi:hypothetical protein